MCVEFMQRAINEYFLENVRMTAVKNVLSGISSGQSQPKLEEQENEPVKSL